MFLGCSCKDDLSCAHKQCAETWFKIRGNRICEICGSTACNVVGIGDAEFIEQWNESSNTAASQMPASEPRRFMELRIAHSKKSWTWSYFKQGIAVLSLQSFKVYAETLPLPAIAETSVCSEQV
ncbi:hypothetical protein OsJ_04088 [Oryza sativa Japonica Group]|uniref:RING-CH-type domain-containing protein n=1 Tax=Oryza sativa subsp. japonica TaxID=39947 RepID=B9EUF4_ORYSJ|nr:hypothetical protein OsJ_04088 [Oryza sativa Japonica Group]